MEFICEKDRLQLTVRDSWAKLLVPKILELAEREKHTSSRVRSLFDSPPISKSMLL